MCHVIPTPIGAASVKHRSKIKSTLAFKTPRHRLHRGVLHPALFHEEIRMKSIMTLTAAVVSALALSACGGGSDSAAPNRADEGIWSADEMQMVILSDGSYWGIYGGVPLDDGITLPPITVVSHGTASISGNNISGAYTTFPFIWTTDPAPAPYYGNGTYSGTVSAQNNLSATFNGPMLPVDSFNLSYDSNYSHPASLATIAGHYVIFYPHIPGFGPDVPAYPSLSISESNLTLYDGNGNVAMTGTIAPHGTTVNVFDVSLTTTSANPLVNIPNSARLGIMTTSPAAPQAGTTFNGILYQISTVRLARDYIEVVATAGDSVFYFAGNK